MTDHVCVQPGDLGARGRERLGGTLHEGKRQVKAWVWGMGVGTTALAEGSMPRPPPAEESGEGIFSRGGDADGGAPWAQSGTSGWAGSELSPRRYVSQKPRSSCSSCGPSGR